MCGEASTEHIVTTTFGAWVGAYDGIMHAKFQDENLKVQNLRAVEIWPPLLTLHMGANTVLRYRAACDKDESKMMMI